MTRADLARRLGVTQRHVGLIERGGCYPSLELLIKAARVLRTEPANFMFSPHTPSENLTNNSSDPRIGHDADVTGGNDANGPGSHDFHAPLITACGVWSIDFATGRETWSPGLTRMLGYAGVGTSLRTAFLKRLSLKGAKKFNRFLAKILERGRPLPLTCEITRPDGLQRIVYIQAEQIEDADPTLPDQARLFLLDITEWRNSQNLTARNQRLLETVIHERTRELYTAAENAETALEQRTAAQRDLETKSRQLERLFTATPAILYSFVPEVGGTEFYSPHVQRILGYTEQELIQKPMLWRNSVHPEDAARVDEAIARGMQGIPANLEYRIKTKTGQWRWLHDLAYLAHDEQGQAFFTGVSMDITERKHMEEELAKTREALHKKSSRRYRRRNELVYRFEFSPKRGFSYISPSVVEITGYSAEEHYTDPELPKKIIHPDDLPGFQRAVQEAVPESRDIDLRWISRDGRVIWTEHHVVPITDDQGELLALEGFVRDVTATRQAEEEQKQLLARYRALFENSSEGVFLHDLQGNILDANQAVLDMFGYPLAELRAMHPVKLVHPEHVKDVQARFREILELNFLSCSFSSNNLRSLTFLLV